VLTARGKLTATLRVTRPQAACPPAALLEAAAGWADPAVLESSARHETFGRYSIFACRPLEVVTLREGVLRDSAGRALAAGSNARLWAALGRAFGLIELRGAAAGVPYVPGWIGYLSYELGRHVERLPGRAPRDTRLPDLRLGLYDALLVYDAVAAAWTLVELAFDEPPAGAGAGAAALRAALASPGAVEPPPQTTEQADPARREAATAEANFTPAAYRSAVRRCVDYIAAGDIFQVNLSQRLTVANAPPPTALYRALRRRNPAWYAAFLRFEADGAPCAVVSSSPELFLRVRGDAVLTRPIKGTRPRSGAPEADARTAAELLASPKDNAELAMIVDLLRNDLGRVCRYGSVRVTDPRRLETHPTVFHLVGTVAGRLCAGVGMAGLLRATFPGGSITGAPKIRTMEIIDALEPVARSVYTGCIGIVGADGGGEWNIAIRTIVCDGRRALIQVGGGIVADSDPAAEYQETLDKARALLEAVADAQRHAAAPSAAR
jgi:para-aminobenzoate synthetase component 1